MKRPKIIAVSGVSGGGKTTVIKALNRKISLSECIHFDDYDFEECPEDFFQWIQRGADYNEWNLDKLREDIIELRAQSNLEYILMDYPFAYKNKQVAEYIDCAIFVDTPLDIAMARRILREKMYERAGELEEDLKCYISHGRIAYLEALKTIKPNSDFVMDGKLSVEEIVSCIMEVI